jgi:hypothetical protein
MKIKLLSLAVFSLALLAPAPTVRAQSCPSATNFAAQRAPQSVALTWLVAPGADAVLCYRWTMQLHGWRCDWQQVLAGAAESLVDNTLGPAKTYQYGIAVHYPACGWSPWQYIVVGPYSSSVTPSLK